MRVVTSAGLLLLASVGCTSGEAETDCVPVLQGWFVPAAGQPHYFFANNIRVRGQDIRWNSTPVDEETLQAYLKQSAQLEPMPFIVFDPTGANCEMGVRVRNLIDRNYPCREGACGQGARAAFDEAPFRTHTPR